MLSDRDLDKAGRRCQKSVHLNHEVESTLATTAVKICLFKLQNSGFTVAVEIMVGTQNHENLRTDLLLITTWLRNTTALRLDMCEDAYAETTL